MRDELELATSLGCLPRGTFGWYCCRCPLKTFNSVENVICRKCNHRWCGYVGVSVDTEEMEQTKPEAEAE
jgi:hypothetical protein